MESLDLQSLLADPEFAQKLMELGVLDEQGGLMGQQMAQADALRNSPMPEGMNAGGTFIAANPLQFAASAMGRIKGQHQMDDIMGQRPVNPATGQPDTMYGNLDKKKAGRMAFAEALARALREQPQEPTAPVQAPELIGM